MATAQTQVSDNRTNAMTARPKSAATTQYCGDDSGRSHMTNIRVGCSYWVFMGSPHLV